MSRDKMNKKYIPNQGDIKIGVSVEDISRGP